MHRPLNRAFLGVLLTIAAVAAQSPDVDNATHATHATHAATGELLFTTVLHRHGDRTPLKPYPNDPWGQREFWPAGWGQLTAAGKRQMYELGTWLRRRYLGTVLRERYHMNDIRIESSDFDRTLMSAAICTAALFPPAADERWSPDGQLAAVWEPVPVHSVPQHLDDRLWVGRPCAAFERQLAAVKAAQLQHYRRHHAHLMDYVRHHSGCPMTDSMWDMLIVYDALLVESAANLTLPEWTLRVFPHDGPLRQATLEAYRIETQKASMARLKFGWLLRDILQRFRDKADGRLVPAEWSMWVYSAHDLTVAGMLNMLGMYDMKFPSFAAALLFELRRIDGVAYVQLFYRNAATDAEPSPMRIPGCGTLCPLQRMFELYEAVLPTGTWEEECRLPAEGADAAKRSTGSRSAALAASTATMMMMAMLLLAVQRCG